MSSVTTDLNQDSLLTILQIKLVQRLETRNIELLLILSKDLLTLDLNQDQSISFTIQMHQQIPF